MADARGDVQSQHVFYFYNRQDRPIGFFLEPWGLGFEIPPGAKFALRLDGRAPAEIEAEHDVDALTVWVNPALSYTLLHGGVELSRCVGYRPLPMAGDPP